jgi:hypothetical protein
MNIIQKISLLTGGRLFAKWLQVQVIEVRNKKNRRYYFLLAPGWYGCLHDGSFCSGYFEGWYPDFRCSNSTSSGRYLKSTVVMSDENLDEIACAPTYLSEAILRYLPLFNELDKVYRSWRDYNWQINRLNNLPKYQYSTVSLESSRSALESKLSELDSVAYQLLREVVQAYNTIEELREQVEGKFLFNIEDKYCYSLQDIERTIRQTKLTTSELKSVSESLAEI